MFDTIVRFVFTFFNPLTNNPLLFHCSYLAIVVGLAAEADYVFIPEEPVENDWETKICEKLQLV